MDCSRDESYWGLRSFDFLDFFGFFSIPFVSEELSTVSAFSFSLFSSRSSVPTTSGSHGWRSFVRKWRGRSWGGHRWKKFVSILSVTFAVRRSSGSGHKSKGDWHLCQSALPVGDNIVHAPSFCKGRENPTLSSGSSHSKTSRESHLFENESDSRHNDK